MSIGLMEGAYFVGRKEIVDFINTTLELKISKVEETASGAVACQLLDIMYPNVVPMQKVDWSAKKDFEFLSNYKILQTCFSKLRIDRHIDVDRLITAKYMDNLEFMQWFKRYFEMQVADRGDYDCKTRRALGKGGASVAAGKPSSPTSAVVKASGMAAPGARTVTTKPAKVVSPKPASAPTKKASSMATLPSSGHSSSPSDNSTAKQVAALTKQVDELRAANEEASRSGNELRTEMEGLEKERDFYFEKLREIEIVLQDIEDNGKGTDLTASIFKILYATQDGFEQSADFQAPVNENAPINLLSSPVQQLIVDQSDDM